MVDKIYIVRTVENVDKDLKVVNDLVNYFDTE